ncbi:hypothetical protein D3C73_1435010 [compost metagenome]
MLWVVIQNITKEETRMDKNLSNNGISDVNVSGNQVSFVQNQQGRKITHVRKEGSDIVAYKLDDGTVADEQEIVALAQQGMLPGYQVSSREGQQYIRSYPDGDESNNLQNLPTF